MDFQNERRGVHKLTCCLIAHSINSKNNIPINRNEITFSYYFRLNRPHLYFYLYKTNLCTGFWDLYVYYWCVLVQQSRHINWKTDNFGGDPHISHAVRSHWARKCPIKQSHSALPYVTSTGRNCNVILPPMNIHPTALLHYGVRP